MKDDIPAASLVERIDYIHDTCQPRPEWLGLPLDHEVMLTDEEEAVRGWMPRDDMRITVADWTVIGVFAAFMALGIALSVYVTR